MREDIWLVYGAEGEYSDHREWAVAWFPTEEEAEKYVAAIVEEAERLMPEAVRLSKGWCAFDKSMEEKYGTWREAWERMTEEERAERGRMAAGVRLTLDPETKLSDYGTPKYYAIKVKQGVLPSPFNGPKEESHEGR